jgi:putative endonuclease
VSYKNLYLERLCEALAEAIQKAMDKQPCVYILASKQNGTLYTGVTSNIRARLLQHSQGHVESFTKKYHVHILVYMEVYDDMYTAITREKQIKAGSRKKKIALIEKDNPTWRDISDTV